MNLEILNIIPDNKSKSILQMGFTLKFAMANQNTSEMSLGFQHVAAFGVASFPHPCSFCGQDMIHVVAQGRACFYLCDRRECRDTFRREMLHLERGIVAFTEEPVTVRRDTGIIENNWTVSRIRFIESELMLQCQSHLGEVAWIQIREFVDLNWRKVVHIDHLSVALFKMIRGHLRDLRVPDLCYI